jgi:hypothetical protein
LWIAVIATALELQAAFLVAQTMKSQLVERISQVAEDLHEKGLILGVMADEYPHCAILAGGVVT